MVDFLKYKWFYFAISAIVIGAGLFSTVRWGYRYSIDFVGGTNLEYSLSRDVKREEIEKVFKKQKVELIDFNIRDKVFTARTKAIDEKKESALREELKKDLKMSVTVLRTETVGPTLGRETMIKTLTASVIAMIGILLYMTFSFKGWTYALAAILALLHDIVVLLGTYSLISHFFGAEVDTLFVTAVLTTMSFSVHDTIVVFDKIREYMSTSSNENVEAFANKALTETMVRSLNNSFTIIFMLLALVLLGGTTIRFFSIALLVGTITGTYSSPFVATPLLVWLGKRKK